MATVVFEGVERIVPDGSAVQEACEEMGMPFGCTEGLCGTCRCMVVSGFENLGPLTDEEQEMGLEENERLICQCLILKGSVEFTID